MLLGADFDLLFKRAIRVLQPYLPDVLCVGGCANALYRYHRQAAPVAWGYIGTTDIDIAVPQSLPATGRPLVAALLGGIGLRAETLGTAAEPVVKYVPVDEGVPAELEFLCDLSGLRRRPISHRVQPDLRALPLRYLGMLFSHPWTVELGAVPGFGDVGDLHVQVPNPAAYVMQKILIRNQQRSPACADKDCFYIYEVSVVFREALDAIRDEYQRLEPCSQKWKARFESEARRLFESEYSDGPSSVVDIASDSSAAVDFGGTPSTAEAVQRSVARLLDAMTG